MSREIKPAPQTHVPDGWMLVPIEPTPEMKAAGEIWSGLPGQTWTDMLDAVLEPPAPVSELPTDIVALAEACYIECEQMDSDGIVETIGKFIAAERERCAQIADAHASVCFSKLHKKRSDHDLAVFESAAFEAHSIAATIRRLSVETREMGE